MNQKDPELLKIADAARLLGVNRRTIYRRIWNGELPASKVGGLYFIRRTDLEDLLTPKQKQATVTPKADETVGGISGSLARSREQIFLRRVKERVEGIEALLHPISRQVIPMTPQAWQACRRSGDERAVLMSLLGVMVLDAKTADRFPLNAWLRWELPASSEADAPPLAIQAQAFSRLDVLHRQGADDRPLDETELAPILDAAIREQSALILALASPTGWSSEAAHLARQFTDVANHAWVYLVDSTKMKLIYNKDNEILRGYADIFSKLE